jgi:hypothetical protein
MDHPEIILQIQDIELIFSDLSGRKMGTHSYNVGGSVRFSRALVWQFS